MLELSLGIGCIILILAIHAFTYYQNKKSAKEVIAAIRHNHNDSELTSCARKFKSLKKETK